MTRLEALVALNLTSSIGGIKLKKLLEFFDEPQDIFRAPAHKLSSIYGIGGVLAGRICNFSERDLKNEFRLAGEFGLEILSLEDADYPALLKQIPDAPIILYVKGEIKEVDVLSIAVVGSRQASFYGLSTAEKFSGELAAYGFTIVSGLARGVDMRAHQGALKAKGRTIAVMGSGFKHIYPDENKELAEEIARNGAVVSEFPLNESPLRQNFPRRNRIISGISQAVFVIEASRNSGALITADFALEQGRDVFALPGKVDSRNSFGTNELIKQGAKLISCVDDIIEELNIANQDTAGSTFVPEESKLNIAEDESILYNLISHQPLCLDDIVGTLNMDVARVSGALLGLQIKKLIKELPGKQFIKVA